MSAYFVASIRITNPEGYQSYVDAFFPTLQAYNGETLVADPASQVIEGEPNALTVLLRFASKEAAMAWSNSPEYQAIKHDRTDNSEGTVVLVDALTTGA